MKKFNIIVCILLLVMSLSAFGETVVPLPDVNRPNWFFHPIFVVGEKIIIADGLRVLFYSAKDFKLLRTFGKKGEGPQEFLGYDDGVCVLPSLSPDSLVIDSIEKISFYTKDGDFKKSIKTKNANYFRSLGDDEYFVGFSVFPENNILYGGIGLYDHKFNKVKSIGKFKEPFLQIKVNPLEYRRPLPIVYDNKLFLDRPDGSFDVFDKKGNLLYTFKYDFERIPVTNAHKKLTIELLKLDPRIKDKFQQFKSRIVFDKYFPIMKHYDINDGKIYVLTYKEVDNKNEFIVLDTKGKFIKKILFPMKSVSFVEPYPYTINKGKIYQLVENDDKEIWELHISDFD